MTSLEEQARALLEDDLHLLYRRDLDNIPPLSWLVKHIIPTRGVGLIIGQSTAGKSFAAVDLQARISLGLSWFGHRVKACPVLYIALEGQAGVRGRIEAWERFHQRPVPDGFRILLTRLELTKDVDRLADAIRTEGLQGGLIVIDTLAQASPGTDENSSTDMSLIVAALQRLQSEIGGVVIAVHHMGKDVSKGARGHSSLYAACDFILAVQRDGDARLVTTDPASGGKAKDAQEVTHQFELKPVPLGIDTDGEPTGSLVVVPVADDARRPRKERKLTGGQKTAINAFHAASKKADKPGHVALDAWRAEFNRLSTADSPDAKRKAFTRARTDLVESGRLVVSDDVYSLPDKPDMSGQSPALSRTDRTSPYKGCPVSGHVEVGNEFCPASPSEPAQTEDAELIASLVARFEAEGQP